jgi:tripartite-type tricarboxylate transporter receptor subunit TctC
LFVPAGTPEDRIEKVRADAMGLMALPEIRASIEQAGFQAITGPQPDYPAMVKRDVAKWQRVVQESGATVN